MRITADHIVYENLFPSFSAEVFSGTTLTITRDGDTDVAICGFRRGSAKVSPDGRVLLRESRDGGITWGTVPSPLDAEGGANIAPVGGLQQLAGPHLGASPEGTVILAAALMTLAEPGTPRFRSDAAGIVDGRCVFVRRGVSGWEPALILDGSRSADEWSITCAPPVPLGGGRWFAPAERHAADGGREWLRRYNAFSFVSTDDGRTWTDHGQMLNDPDRVFAFYDQHVVSLGEGRILSLAWTHDVVEDKTITAHASLSEDGGATWSPPWDTGILGGPVGLVELPDGRLFATYPRRQSPTGIRACISRDGGLTWDLDEEIVIWDEASRSIGGDPSAKASSGKQRPLWQSMWGWTFGLPTPSLYADGSVGIVFYAAGRDGVSRVIHVRIEP